MLIWFPQWKQKCYHSSVLPLRISLLVSVFKKGFASLRWQLWTGTMIPVMTPGDLKISWKWMCCGFQGVRLQLGCCDPRGAGSVEAVLSFQHTGKVCLVDRLKLENVRCFHCALLSPKTNLFDTWHILSVDTHVPMCVFFSASEEQPSCIW